MKKIILIDDNQSNQREIYGASFIDKGEYDDLLVHIEKLNESCDFSFLKGAACVLLHDSLDDYVDGRFISGARKAKDAIWEIVKCSDIPYVIFSDGHSIIGDWSPTEPNVVRNIKKSEFYRNLKPFLDTYCESSHIDLRLIAYGNDYEKRELVGILQKVFGELKNVNDKEILAFSLVDTDLLERFFKKVKHVSSLTFEKLCDSIHAGKLTVGKFKAYINSLAGHAIRYTAKVPKQNIILLGNDLSKERLSALNNVTFKTLNTFQLGEKGEKEMFDNISSCIPSDADAIIIDIDSTKTPDACLSYALAIRLSLHEKKKAALAPIIFMSSLTPDIFKNSPYSTLLQTKGVSFETPLYTPTAVELMEPLSPKDYRPYFLDFIKVKPNSTEGSHSIANQWGADVLGRFVPGDATENVLIRQARQSLYFRYVLALTLKQETFLSLFNNDNNVDYTNKINVIDATGKKILLIDDEADKGWKDIIGRILANSNLITYNKQTADYANLSEDIRKEIEKEDVDVILLDLRINGMAEDTGEHIRPYDFSGMKVLKEIKKINPGLQVIMLTASNKAWNMKALLDAGADGYYIKESPDYAFPIEYSSANANNLVKQIERCFGKKYLRTIYTGIRQLKSALDTCGQTQYFCNRIKNQLNISYILLSKAKTKQDFAFAYITLEQIVEIITDEFISQNRGIYIIRESGDVCLNWQIQDEKCIESTSRIEKELPQWKMMASIYYQFLDGDDDSFGARIQNLIEKRNAFMHNDVSTLNANVNGVYIHHDLYNKDGYVKLFNTIKQVVTLI